MQNKTIVGTIKYISDKVRQKADNNLKDHNLTLSQVRVLRFLTCVGGSCSQKEIEDYLQVSHPTVVGIVSRMEQSGFLQTCFGLQDPQQNRDHDRQRQQYVAGFAPLHGTIRAGRTARADRRRQSAPCGIA